jgi:hypothetical protein
LSFFCPLVPSVCSSRLDEKKSGSRAAAIQSWRNGKSWSAAVACA